MSADRLVSISGHGGKAPACFLLETGGRRLILDLGAGPDAGARPDLARLGPDRRVDAILLSHAHGDHVGSLDAWPMLGRPPVFATEVTSALVGHPQVRPLPLRGAATILGIPLATGRSGHAPGGVWLHFGVAGGLFYAGDMDFSRRVFAIDHPPPARTAILDASYGTFDAPEAETEAALAACLRSDGPVLLPVPADGRGPELALWVRQITGRWPRVDGEIRRIAGRLAGPWGDCVLPGRSGQLAALAAEAPPADRAQGVILAGSAQLEGGAAAGLAEPVLAAGGCIVLTGHAARGKRAAALLAEGRACFRRWPVHPRLGENAALVRRLGAARILPAFGDAGHDPAWRAAFPGTEIILGREVPL